MFDCGGPVLVFVTQTHHPLFEYHTGYIFAYYEFHYHKPKEMFFRHVAEAQVFALYRKARLEMDASQAPERVTALEYVLNGEDESKYINMPELRHNAAARKRAAAKQQMEYEFNAAIAELEQDMADLLFDDSGGDGGAVAGAAADGGPEDSGVHGVGSATADATGSSDIDWFGGD